jgi:type I restriction enzyme M protein
MMCSEPCSLVPPLFLDFFYHPAIFSISNLVIYGMPARGEKPLNHSEIVSFIWGVADLIRDTFKRGKYQDVILPLTVLRRLDCVLAPTKERVLSIQAKLADKKLENLDPQLRKAAGFAFYNISRYDFDKLLADAPHLAANLRNYIAGFSPNMREVLEKFDFDNTISKLDEAGLLFQVLERFKNVDLHPDKVDNAAMGTIFEELIRKFNEALNENPGEHFTPRDVVHLMADLLFSGDEDRIRRKGVVISVYDPCCGSGGMLTISKGHVLSGRRKNGGLTREPINPDADIHLFGQEVNPETFAVCKSDLFMKSIDGRDAENIVFGSALSNDRHAGRNFDYLIANPPYGKDWKRDEEAVVTEHERGISGRFRPGLPRISDGQLLFLLHMLAHMKELEGGGSRMAIIMNGSPLFTGDAGSGESEIRRFVLENDWLEALIAVPEQLFYNTGIATYIWILTNRKAPKRKGKIQLIDATSFWVPMRKSLGDKRREIPPAKAEEILRLLLSFEEGEFVKIFPTTRFGFRKITAERPLKLNLQASPERIVRLDKERAFLGLVQSKKKGEAATREQSEGRKYQEAIRNLLRSLPNTLFKDRTEFEEALSLAARKAGLKLPAPINKAILAALSERDETASVCRDKDGNPEPDPELRDTESVPLEDGDDPADDQGVPASVQAFFDREVKPYVPDAWIDTSRRDAKDSRVGIVGYEINFNRYFYKYSPPRPLEEIEADIRAIERDIIRMLAEITGSKPDN